VPRQWQFLLVAVSFPILGVDFLCPHSLVVDVAKLSLSPPLPPVSAVHPWVVLGGRCPLIARGLPAGPGWRPHLHWRPLFTLTLFHCRRRPLWLAGGQAGTPLSTGGISTLPPLPVAATSFPAAYGDWLAGL
jgi:hypothetical protein